MFLFSGMESRTAGELHGVPGFREAVSASEAGTVLPFRWPGPLGEAPSLSLIVEDVALSSSYFFLADSGGEHVPINPYG